MCCNNVAFLLFSEVEFFGNMFCEAHVQIFPFMYIFNECVKLCMGSSYRAESDPMDRLETEGSLKFWN